MPALRILLIAFLLGVDRAAAHGVDNDAAGAVWTFDPWVVVPLASFGLLYALGGVRLWTRTAAGRKQFAGRIASGLCGGAMLAAALMSPLHWLGEHIFTFHMIEHEIVMAVAAPLLVAARPLAVVLWGLPRGTRRWVGAGAAARTMRMAWEWLTRSANASVLHAIAIWGWHVPALFDAAVSNVVLHRLQHFSFFITAVFFWWSVLWRSSRGAAAWYLFLTMMHTGILGALMALAPRVLYTAQTRAAQSWGLTPLEDQQLAGIVMWIPAGTIYAGAALTMAALWIARSGRPSRGVQHAPS
jgi:cytochrome c oxidase assembly factor CtaG